MSVLRKITDELYFVGGYDRRLERFENMFILPGGVSYNSYLWKDEKNVLLDAVDLAVSEEFLESLEEALDGEELDYLVSNHMEPDHASSIHEILLRYPNCRFVCSAKGIEFLKQFYRRDYDESRFMTIKNGDLLESGKRRFRFIAAPNVHWPEVTVCYEETSASLFSADAFGSFGVPDGHLFADQVDYACDWLPEARRYYCNIVGRQGAAVQRLFRALEGVRIHMICPLHGLIFRDEASIGMILDKYRQWSGYTAEERGVVLIYGSMYNHSQRLMDRLAGMLADRGVKKIKVYDVSKTDVSYLVADCFQYSHLVFGCNNYNTELYPKMDAFLRELMMLNWDNHCYSLLGNMSWGGRGLAIATEILSKAKNLSRIGEDVVIKSSLDRGQLPQLEALAEAIAASVMQEA